MLSVALSLKRPKSPRRALPGTVVPWSPDFPRRKQASAAAAQSPGRGDIGGTASFFESSANFTNFMGTGAIFVNLAAKDGTILAWLTMRKS